MVRIKMKKRRRYSSSSDEDMPLKTKKHSKKHEHKDKDGLFVRSVEKCEFCDEVFYNKYSMLVHNAKHIIIPLLRQSLHQCTECLHYCNSVESLEWHLLQKHPHITNNVPELLESFTKKEPLMILLREKVDTNKTSNELLRSFVCKEPVTLLTKNKLVVEKENELVKNSPLQCFVQKEAVTLLEPLDVRKDLQVINDIINISDDSDDDNQTYNDNNQTYNDDYQTYNDDNQTYTDSNNTYNDDNETYNDTMTNEKNEDANDINEIKDPSFKIKDRIMFEEDEDVIDPNELINDLTTECKVNLQSINSQNVGSKIILGNMPKYESVHYDDLVKPGVYRCKKCHMSFPNRYKEIIHEAGHIKIRNRLPFVCRFCDWNISTSPWALKLHIQTKHPGKVMPSRQFTKCRKCGLNYITFYKHMRNYHHVYFCYVNGCSKYFETNEELRNHRRKHRSKTETADTVMNGECYSKTVNMCDVCYTFMKKKISQNYEFLGAINEVGIKHRCKVCMKKFSDMNIVKMRAKKHKTRTAMDLHEKKKLVTNVDRLRMVQQRLKKLKLMNKY